MPQPTPSLPAKRFLLVLLFGTTVLLGLMLYQLLGPLLLGVVLAGAFWPLQQWLSRALKGRRGLASSIIVVGCLFILVAPIAGFSVFLVNESSRGIRFVRESLRGDGMNGLVSKLPETLQRPARTLLEYVPANGDDNIPEMLQQQGGKAALAIGRTTGSLVFGTTMMLVALFLLLIHAPVLLAWVDQASPLKRGQTHELLKEFKTVSVAVLVSTGITSGVQALAAMVGYLIARVPFAIFFTALTFVFAFIPAIGAGSVGVVAALVLLVTGHPYAALFLAIWSVTVVALIDNVVKPLLIRRGMNMNEGLVFFALIGGLAAFGAIGLLLGPLLVSFFLALLRMYHRDFRSAEDGPKEEIVIPDGVVVPAGTGI